MTTIPGRATVTQYNTNTGQARMRVSYNGAQQSTAYDFNSHDPFLTALLDVLGRRVKINDSERQQPFKRIVFYIDPNTTDGIRPDYTLHTWADGFGTWHCRIDFTYGAGNTGEGERLISNAERAAKRAIRAEIIARSSWRAAQDMRLRYHVAANRSAGSGALMSLTIAEGS